MFNYLSLKYSIMNVAELKAELTAKNVEFTDNLTKAELQTLLNEAVIEAEPKKEKKVKRKIAKKVKGVKSELVKSIVKRYRYDEDTDTREHLITSDKGVQYRLFSLLTIDKGTDNLKEEVKFTSFEDDIPSQKKIDKGLYTVVFTEKIAVSEGDELPFGDGENLATNDFIWGENPRWIRL
jgi:hypothetical protein